MLWANFFSVKTFHDHIFCNLNNNYFNPSLFELVHIHIYFDYFRRKVKNYENLHFFLLKIIFLGTKPGNSEMTMPGLYKGRRPKKI